MKVIWTKSGDILTFGTSKIITDSRLRIDHRYVSEWHLIIDDIVTDDEGEYICKTNGNFFKIVNLQVLSMCLSSLSCWMSSIFNLIFFI